jgi:xylan 1,4-beta-xylosidase
VVHGAIKSVDPSLRVGGPSTAHSVWLRDLIDFGSKNNCMPDYIVGHIYNNDSAAGDPLSPFDGPQGDKENKSPHFLTGITRGARKLLDEAGFKGEFHMNEWGLSWHPFAPVRETANEAAFIVKSMCEVSQQADYFAYWCISDIYNQVGYGREAFHGNYGMISLDGLRKPNYFAHQLLCRLGNEQIPFSSVGADSQTNVIVSRNNNVLQILAYAFDIEYQAGDIAGSCQIEVEIPANANIQAASVFRIDSRNNNILHVWKEMGSPAHPKLQEVKQMIDVNNLTSEPFRGPINKVQQGLAIKLDFETPGVILIEVPLKN